MKRSKRLDFSLVFFRISIHNRKKKILMRTISGVKIEMKNLLELKKELQVKNKDAARSINANQVIVHLDNSFNCVRDFIFS